MSTPVPSFDRARSIERLVSERFDVVVVGGGITGAGIALDAASRGLRTALVEKDDFASGTSSKSSKLVHGGLRYLEQREFRLVYESLHERQRLLDNAPHLCEPQPFLIPLFGKAGVANKIAARKYATALWLYDLTGGIRIGKRHSKVSAAEAAAHMPTLRTDRLAAGFLYWDARIDDARLTLAVARTAALDHGAVVANRARVTGIEHDARGRACGVTIEGPGIADGTVVRAESVVNATGVWADDVRGMDEGGSPNTIRPAKGIHVAVRADRLPCDIASVIPVRADRRSIFVIPWAWGGQTYIGTTDTDYTGPLDDPECTADDVSYLLDAVNAFLSDPLEPGDVIGTWAGLRPLVASGARARSERTADLSRRHFISTSSSGIVTVTGGKLTTYRKMASDTVDTVQSALGRRGPGTRTKKMALRGAADFRSFLEASGPRDGVDSGTLRHLARRYGGESDGVIAMCRENPSLTEPLVPGLPYLCAEAVFAARHEMATTLDDVLARRTRALLFDTRATVDAAPRVARLLAPELGWNDSDCAAHVAELARTASLHCAHAGLPDPGGT